MSISAVGFRDSDPAMPYRASWVNRLLDWINSLPVPALLVYAGAWVILLAISHLAGWFNGIVPRGELDPRILIVSAWTPYCLGFMGYLNQTAGRALDDFRPALDLSDAEFHLLRYKFTALPAGPVIVANVLGVALVVTSVFTSPETTGPFLQTPWLAIVNFSIASLGIMLSMAAIYQTFRQLRLIRHTYGRATRLKLFQASQLYAFSALTLRIAIGWLLIIYTGVLAFPALLQDTSWAVTSGILILASAFSYLSTLQDIHRHISVDKARHLDEVHTLLAEVFSTINRRVQDQQMEDMARLKETAEALDLERAVLSRVPTWPWQPGTLASFVTALALPLLVWLAQTLLSRLL